MRLNPTRRGDIKLDRCLCGYDRKREQWARNGCKQHGLSLECQREEHGNCQSLVCRCEHHNVEIDYFGAGVTT